MNEFFEDILTADRLQEDRKKQYHLLDQTVQRMVQLYTRDFAADFTNRTARMYALCQATGFPSHRLEVFTAHAQQVARGTWQPEETDWCYDLKAVCEATAFFTQEGIPEALAARLPAQWRKREKTPPRGSAKRIRVTVTGWDETFIYGTNEDYPPEQPLAVTYRQEDGAFDALPSLLYEGAQLNVLSAKLYPHDTEQGTGSRAEGMLLVLDPDFLIDITALCQCYKPYGIQAQNHLINKFSPPARSAALQLGNLANHFLDECVNENREEEMTEKECYEKALFQSFEMCPLEYTTLPDLTPKFFQDASQQFHHIRETVHHQFRAAEIDIEQQEVALEPSFLCEALGMQGRMDLLVRKGNKIVELKSGKAEEYPKRRPRLEHELQMALYQEILYYNMDVPREEIQTYLFYSRYPQFYHIRFPKQELRQALQLRNEIVALERQLRNGEAEKVLAELTEEKLVDPAVRQTAFYQKYLRPGLVTMTQALQGMDETEGAYFRAFLTFTEREQFLAKTGDDTPDSGRGFAELWHADTASKQHNGNILTDLTLCPLTDEQGCITHLSLTLPTYEADFLPNFRAGDSVLLYERNETDDRVTNKQVFRCQIERITPQEVQLRLLFRQRNSRMFPTTSRYALEPGYADTSYTQAYQGLYQLLRAPRDRRDLILGRRMPERNTTRQLHGHYGAAETDAIVLAAKQACDYFLLVGPPGTGKTSVALSAMVQEFLSEEAEKNLLLMAYTNRAVDEICEMLEALPETPEYVRIGQELNCEPRFRSRLLKNKIKEARNRKEIYGLLEPVRVFVGTISSISGRTDLFELKRFDVAIVDEASQVLEPQLLPLLCATTSLPTGNDRINPCALKKFILIGDHKQLPAVVMQSPLRSAVHDPRLQAIGLTNCRNSLFERLHRLQTLRHTEGIVALLHRQGRMHEELSAFVNRTFYNNALDLVPLPHQQGRLEMHTTDTDPWKQFVSHTRLGFLPVVPAAACDNNKVNREEAVVVARLIRTLYELVRENGLPFLPGKQIGVIVPFRGQIAMVRQALAQTEVPGTDEITIDTVERYQGSQRDVILFCTTIHRPYQTDLLSVPVQIEGQWVDRKLNVALTRARKQFFLTGNPELLERAPSYQSLLEYIRQKKGWFTPPL